MLHVFRTVNPLPDVTVVGRRLHEVTGIVLSSWRNNSFVIPVTYITFLLRLFLTGMYGKACPLCYPSSTNLKRLASGFLRPAINGVELLSLAGFSAKTGKLGAVADLRMYRVHCNGRNDS